jgi:hypothetical protein
MLLSLNAKSMNKEDLLHEEIRDWIEEQGFPAQSLDELIYSDRMVKSFMNDKQKKEAQDLMDRFLEI